MRILYLFLMVFIPSATLAATPRPQTPPPGYAPNPEISQPEILPNGSIDLDAQWTNDGGARLYWDTVKLPQELKMNGREWQDPALMPQLNVNQPKVTHRKGTPATHKKAVKPASKSKKVVKKAARKKKAVAQTPPIPLPVNEDQPLPPLSPRQQEERWVDARTDSPYIEPPRLQ